MALLYIQQLSGREIDIGKFDDQTRRRQWWVLTDSRFYNESAVLQEGILAGSFPVPYVSTFPDEPAYLCKRLTGKQEKQSPLHWIVTAMWDTKPWDDTDEESPLDREAKIEWSTIKYQKAIEKDRDGDAILNSAGDYFDPPPLKDVSRWTATVTKNVWPLPSGIISWRDKTNNADWSIDGLSIAKNVAKVMQIRVSPKQREGDELFRQLSYTVEFDDVDMWQGKYLNQGYYFIDPEDGERKRIQVGTPPKDCVSPQLLDTNGDVIDDPQPSNATFEEYDVEDEMDFSVLPVT
jgi:hypothetical protein